MSMTARYTVHGTILATIDGVEMTVPIDPANRHYAELIASGGDIALVEAVSHITATAEKNDPLFSFNGATFRYSDLIIDAAKLAGLAVKAGVADGELRWHGGNIDFAWLDINGAGVKMDAKTCVAFGDAAKKAGL